MGVPVEAKSLSDLNYLLANPPQYPRNPTHEIHNPLVLYIVRVPGSKDVFLTPLKPATKSSVSLEAIQSSLYYLHVNIPEDEDLERLENGEHTRNKENESIHSSVFRKPLPPVQYANYPASRRPPTPPKSYPAYQPGPDGRTDATQLERFAARGSNVRFSGVDNPSRNSIIRKPLGPRNFGSLVHVERPGLESDAHSNGLTGKATETHPDYMAHSMPLEKTSIPAGGSFTTHLNTASSWDALPSHMSINEARSHLSSSQQSSSSLPIGSTSSTTAITVIRRDPTSGAQWNIGTIQPDGNSISPTLRSISIHLDTPGYLKFDDQQESFGQVDSSNPDAIKEAIAKAREAITTSGCAAKDAFMRTVEFRKKLSSSTSLHLSERGDSPDHIIANPLQNRSSRSVFSFLSPWQGLCVFSNGIDGRSVKCRHTINPRGATNDASDEKKTASVAEIRFNLERSALDAAIRNRRAKSVADIEPDTLPISELLSERHGSKEKLRKGLRRFKNLSQDLKARGLGERELSPPAMSRGNSTYDSEEHVLTEYDPNRLSLKLAREKAGGGYKGKSAKLGKLIIENEGLKMGDLVVAACMGVWWQHYDHGKPHQ